MNNEGIAVPEYTRYTIGSLPERFDSWIRKTLENLVMTEVRSFACKKRKQAEVSLEEIPELFVAADITGRPALSVSEAAKVREEDSVLKSKGEDVVVHDRGLARAMKQLSPRRQQVLIEVFWEERSAGEIARMLNLAKQTVENHKCTALNQLRIWMKESDKRDAQHRK